jgi:hypothetical protein
MTVGPVCRYRLVFVPRSLLAVVIELGAAAYSTRCGGSLCRLVVGRSIDGNKPITFAADEPRSGPFTCARSMPALASRASPIGLFPKTPAARSHQPFTDPSDAFWGARLAARNPETPRRVRSQFNDRSNHPHECQSNGCTSPGLFG